MTETKKGKIHPLYGKNRPFIAGSAKQRIEVKDLLTNETTIYDSISITAATLGIKQSTISSYFHTKQKSPYNGRFEFYKIH